MEATHSKNAYIYIYRRRRWRPPVLFNNIYVHKYIKEMEATHSKKKKKKGEMEATHSKKQKKKKRVIR